jgi:hypothetical protein
MEVQSSEYAALLKLLKTKSRTKRNCLKSAAQDGLRARRLWDALLAEGKVIRIDKEYFANDPSGSVGAVDSRGGGSP